MDRREFNTHIINEIHTWNEDFYTNKIKDWAESMGLPGEQTARRILRNAPRRQAQNQNICRGRLASGKKCTKPAKCNGYCGYHRNQSTQDTQQVHRGKINWEHSGPSEVPEGLVIP